MNNTQAEYRFEERAMELNEDIRQHIASLVASDRVVLFMKGTHEMPQCGFSAATVRILDALLPEYTTVNVLEDQTLREGIKAYSNWPTVPQLYIDQAFAGGCDIVKELFNTGALHEALGVTPPDRVPPKIRISDSAAKAIHHVLGSNPEQSVHLSIDARWQHNFTLGPRAGHEVKAEANGIELLMDVASAQRAKGLSIEITESRQGHSFTFENPNSPQLA